MDSSLSPEIRLLIAACNVGVNPPTVEVHPNPHLLRRLAIFHRVASLVYEHRRRLNLPPECHDAFRAATLATLHRNLQFAAELKIALNALEAAGIPVIVLKGAHLMDAVYHNLALRPLSDLDLLVRPEDAPRGLLALKDAGYEMDDRKAVFTLGSDNEVKLTKSGVHDLIVELHSNLNRRTRHHWFPMERIWERSVPYPVEGTHARALCVDDNVIFLCTHCVPHAFSQLIWVRDIAGLAGDCTPAVVDFAREARARKGAWAGLTLAKDMLGAEPSSGILEALSGPDTASLRTLISPHRLFAGTHYSTLESLSFRAVFSDSRSDAASIIGSGALRKAGELRRGMITKKQK